jgi:hypothetical protein
LPSRGIRRKVGGKPAQVRSGAERFIAGAGEDDCPRLLVVASPLHRIHKLGQHLAGEHVALLGIVEGDRGDAVDDLVGDLLEASRAHGYLSRFAPGAKNQRCTLGRSALMGAQQ